MNDSKKAKERTTLRLLMPQWQGGGSHPEYYLGGRLLSWLAPPSSADVEEVAIDLHEKNLQVERGIFARDIVLEQAREARRILERRRPDRVLVLGGECSVDFAPFAYLNERYAGDLAVLWLDAHPDAATPNSDDRNVNFHSMVLSALLGAGDPEFVAEVSTPLSPQRLLTVGLRAALDELDRLAEQTGITLPNIAVGQLANDSGPVLAWLRASGVRSVAVHFDLDVLDPAQFSATNWPEANGLAIETAVRLLSDVAAEFDIVGLGITEYVPHEAALLAGILRRLPLVSDP